MASFSEFVRFCQTRTGCDKGGLYAIQPRGLRGSPIKIGYSFNLLRRLYAIIPKVLTSWPWPG